MKQKEESQVGTFKPARESPGAADLEQVKQERSCCSPCAGWQPDGNAPAGTGHSEARSSTGHQTQPRESASVCQTEMCSVSAGHRAGAVLPQQQQEGAVLGLV